MNKLLVIPVSILALAVALQSGPLSAQTTAQDKSGKAPAATAPMPQAPAPQPGSVLKDQKDKVSYALGLNLGNNFHQQGIEIDPNLLLQGLKDALAGSKALMTEEEMRSTLIQLQNDLR